MRHTHTRARLKERADSQESTRRADSHKNSSSKQRWNSCLLSHKAGPVQLTILVWWPFDAVLMGLQREKDGSFALDRAAYCNYRCRRKEDATDHYSVQWLQRWRWCPWLADRKNTPLPTQNCSMDAECVFSTCSTLLRRIQLCWATNNSRTFPRDIAQIRWSN